MKKKLIVLIILEMIILAFAVGYYVYAEIENGISVSDTPNIFDPLGRTIPSGGTEEYKYEHEGDYYTSASQVKETVKKINSLRYTSDETGTYNTAIEQVLESKSANSHVTSLFCMKQRTRNWFFLWIFYKTTK